MTPCSHESPANKWGTEKASGLYVEGEIREIQSTRRDWCILALKMEEPHRRDRKKVSRSLVIPNQEPGLMTSFLQL